MLANVGDNVWMHDLYVCPDLDIATYALAGIVDREKGWGIGGDTFDFLDQLSKLGGETWFRLGDRDLALNLLRTEMMRRGKSLTEATQILATRLGIEQTILPPTDNHIETHVLTPEGEMHLQEFWVKRKASIAVTGVTYFGSEKAVATKEALHVLESADKIIVCPANPITSIMPILSVKGILEAIRSSKAEKVALSPMIGTEAFSGPAAQLMRSTGRGTDSVAVAGLYSNFLDRIVIDNEDEKMSGDIKRLGVDVSSTKTRMVDEANESRLALFLLE